MSLKITWHGHATWQIESEEYSLVVDPFFDENPACRTPSASVRCQHILVTHGHFDHIADAAKIAIRNGSQVIAIYEIANWLGQQGVSNAVGMNMGGTSATPFGSVKMVPAWHSSTLPDGTSGGQPAGFVVSISGKKIYFSGDTALFSDMELVGRLGIDLAVLPIGDVYTMGVEDSIAAVNLIRPKMVVPSHHGTWPPITQDTKAWSEMVRARTSSEPRLVEPGGQFQL